MPQDVLGIVGAGQLALYTAMAAQKNGLNFHIYAANKDEPAALAFPTQCSFGDLGDVQALQKSLGHCTHIALENEFWSPLQLHQALGGKKFCPDLEGYAMVYGKINQRTLMNRLEVPQPLFRIVNSESELRRAFENLGKSVIIKKDVGGYDGTGNRYANNLEDALVAAKAFGLNDRAVLIEQALTLTRELALTFFVSDDRVTFFPTVETVQDSHVCTTAISPANLVSSERERLEMVAKHLSSAGARGLFTIEFFREERGPWYYNEIAPRPHNSQHLSMDNCELSQYEAIVYWVLNKEFPRQITMTGDAAMVNILGREDSDKYQLELPKVGADVEVRTYMYGKKQSRIGRKLGHLTLLGERNRILEEAKTLSQGYQL